MSTEEIFYGSHFANNYNGAGTGLTSIPKSAIATDTPNAVVIRDAMGQLDSIAILDTARGGTGANTSASTGVAKIAAGVWSASAIVNSDISASASIARNKLAAGTANYVSINNASGILTEEQYLSPSRGGTGQDFSGVGVGPFVVTNSSGVFSASVAYTNAATPSTLVLRDGSGNFSGGTGTFNTISVNTINAAGDITISPAGGDVFLGTNLLHMTPTSIPGGDTMWYVGNVQTIGPATANVITIPTASKTAYQFQASFSCGDTTSNDAAGFSFKVRGKNTGAVTLGTVLQKTRSADAGIATANVNVSLSGSNVVFQVTGSIGKVINWVARVDVVAQTF